MRVRQAARQPALHLKQAATIQTQSPQRNQKNAGMQTQKAHLKDLLLKVHARMAAQAWAEAKTDPPEVNKTPIMVIKVAHLDPLMPLLLQEQTEAQAEWVRMMSITARVALEIITVRVEAAQAGVAVVLRCPEARVALADPVHRAAHTVDTRLKAEVAIRLKAEMGAIQEAVKATTDEPIC
jgi:hypothetical protein